MLSACGVWRKRAVFKSLGRRELHTHIHLDYAKIEFYPVSKKKKKKC